MELSLSDFKTYPKSVRRLVLANNADPVPGYEAQHKYWLQKCAGVETEDDNKLFIVVPAAESWELVGIPFSRHSNLLRQRGFLSAGSVYFLGQKRGRTDKTIRLRVGSSGCWKHVHGKRVLKRSCAQALGKILSKGVCAAQIHASDRYDDRLRQMYNTFMAATGKAKEQQGVQIFYYSAGNKKENRSDSRSASSRSSSEDSSGSGSSADSRPRSPGTAYDSSFEPVNVVKSLEGDLIVKVDKLTPQDLTEPAKAGILTAIKRATERIQEV